MKIITLLKMELVNYKNLKIDLNTIIKIYLFLIKQGR